MSVGKVVDNVIIIGGIGAMAYLLLKKPLPTIEPKQAQPAGAIDTSATPMDKLCDEKKPTIYTDINLYNRCLANSTRNSELFKPLVDPNAMVEIPSLYTTYDATYRSLYLPSGEIKVNTCSELDIAMKGLTKSLESEYRLAGAGTSNKSKIAILEKAKKDTEAKFNKFNCRDKIEAERTKNVIDLQTKGSIKAEESIVKKGFTEQKTYIILGALVLLTGFYIIVKK